MSIAAAKRPTREWSTRRNRKQARLQRVAKYTKGRVLDTASILDALHALIEPGDRVCIEGNNQKQADFLSRNLANLDPARVNNIHLLLSVLGRPEHMDLFERGIAARVDFSFSGPQSLRLAQMVEDRQVRIGAIHTYLELFARYFVDLTPHVAVVAADAADPEGNLYTGANTEETPLIVEAAAFRDGIGIAQVNTLVD